MAGISQRVAGLKATNSWCTLMGQTFTPAQNIDITAMLTSLDKLWRLRGDCHETGTCCHAPTLSQPKDKCRGQARLWSTSRVIFDSRRKPEYLYTQRTRFSSRVAVAARIRTWRMEMPGPFSVRLEPQFGYSLNPRPLRIIV